MWSTTPTSGWGSGLSVLAIDALRYKAVRIQLVEEGNLNNCFTREVDENAYDNANPRIGDGSLALTSGVPGYEVVRVWLGVERKSDNCNTEDMYKDVNSNSYPRRLEWLVRLSW